MAINSLQTKVRALFYPTTVDCRKSLTVWKVSSRLISATDEEVKSTAHWWNDSDRAEKGKTDLLGDKQIPV